MRSIVAVGQCGVPEPLDGVRSFPGAQGAEMVWAAVPGACASTLTGFVTDSRRGNAL